MGLSGVSHKVIKILKGGYTLPSEIQPPMTRSLAIISCYVHPLRKSYLIEALHALMQKANSRTGETSEISKFLQPTFLGFQTKRTGETSIGPEYFEQISDREFQTGNTRKYKDLPSKGGLGDVHRLPRHPFPHANTTNPGNTCIGIGTLPIGAPDGLGEIQILAKSVFSSCILSSKQGWPTLYHLAVEGGGLMYLPSGKFAAWKS